ncbi:MAG: hypothetical protein PHV34_09720 [Verrucomicrobiae bacterium]|nr:hypothetical protein [Verrucomicrobiae bacterium]
MARKIISIVLFVVAGFFVYAMGLLAFVNLDSPLFTNRPPVWLKFAMVSFFFIPAVAALLLGLAVNRFQNWRRDIGIVLVSGAGMVVFVILSLMCLLLSPEAGRVFPGGGWDLFNSYLFGIGWLAALAGTGVTLIMVSRKPL